MGPEGAWEKAVAVAIRERAAVLITAPERAAVLITVRERAAVLNHTIQERRIRFSFMLVDIDKFLARIAYTVSKRIQNFSIINLIWYNCYIFIKVSSLSSRSKECQGCAEIFYLLL